MTRGGVIVIDGEAVGVLWARSRKFENRAYAIDPVAAHKLAHPDPGIVVIARAGQPPGIERPPRRVAVRQITWHCALR